MSEREDGASTDTSTAAPPPPQWLDDLREAALALRELAQAQWQLLGAELRLARTAALTWLVATLAATVFAAGLCLVLLTLLGYALGLWFGSWLWALVALAGLLTLALVAALVLCRRCLHWLSLPGTRAQWHSLARQSVAATSGSQASAKEASHDDTAAQTG